jgi:hypothetical protein
MEIENKGELWDRLENEPERAYRAFETYRNLPSAEVKNDTFVILSTDAD